VIVVLFSTRSAADEPKEEHAERSARMHEIVEAMPGFVSYKEYVSDDGERVAMVRFESEEALHEWGTHPEHREAQRRGREAYFDRYWIQVCRTIRERRWVRGEGFEGDLASFFRQPAPA